MIKPEFRDHGSAEAMADAVAAEVGDAIERAVAARGTALIALPGGSTPDAIFATLAARALPWKAVTIVPTDDRLAAPDSALGNMAMIARHFLPTGARLFPLAGHVADYRAAGDLADARLRELSWPPDLVWLGMGEDGHTASIFAGPDLDAALDTPATRRAVGVMPDPLPATAPVARVTLTGSAIRAAGTILLTITGHAKRVVLEHALRDGPASAGAIGRVLADSASPVYIHWRP